MSQFDEWPSRSGVDERAQNVKVVVDDTSLATVVSRIKAWEFVLLRPFLAVASVMMVWLFVGAVVFLNTLQDPCTEIERRNATHLWNEEQCHSVTYAMALYYSVQCGFSVGFGLLVEEANGARWYTIFHGFCGLTIMAAGMTLFLLRPGGRLGKYVAGEDDDEDADGDGIPDRLEGPLLARWARMFFRRLMLEMPFVLLALTFTSAVVFQSIYHGWSFTTSCYFAFFALSTGGLQGPGGTSDAEMLFTAFFLLIGIPLFGAAMSRVVDWLLDKYVRAVRSSERLLSRQKHLQSKKFKQQQAGLDGVTRDAYAKAAAFAAKAEEEAAEAAEAQKELARAEAVAEEEAAEAAEAAAQAKEALRLAQELEHRRS